MWAVNRRVPLSASCRYYHGLKAEQNDYFGNSRTMRSARGKRNPKDSRNAGAAAAFERGIVLDSGISFGT
jgi:hypothetical protein